MKLAEIRDLDGPNLFMLLPAIKVELILEPGETEEMIARRLAPGVPRFEFRHPVVLPAVLPPPWPAATALRMATHGRA